MPSNYNTISDRIQYIGVCHSAYLTNLALRWGQNRNVCEIILVPFQKRLCNENFGSPRDKIHKNVEKTSGDQDLIYIQLARQGPGTINYFPK